jgi:hypothetical protein
MGNPAPLLPGTVSRRELGAQLHEQFLQPGPRLLWVRPHPQNSLAREMATPKRVLRLDKKSLSQRLNQDFAFSIPSRIARGGRTR